MIVNTPIVCDQLSFISECHYCNLHEYVNKTEPTISSDDNNYCFTLLLLCFTNLQDNAKHKKNNEKIK